MCSIQLIHFCILQSRRIPVERVDISDLSWEDKERVLRILFAKINNVQVIVCIFAMLHDCALLRWCLFRIVFSFQHPHICIIHAKLLSCNLLFHTVAALL